MRVLILAPCDIFPPVHGSSTAIYHTVRELVKRHHLALLLSRLYSENGEPDLRHPNLTIRYARETALDRLGYKGLLLNPLYVRDADRLWRESGGADLIQAELLWSWPAAAWLRRRYGAPVVLVQENVEYLKFRRMGNNSPFLSAIRWLEGWACRAADHVVAVSEVDVAHLRKLYAVPPEKMAVISHCADPEVFSYRPEGAEVVRQALGIGEDVPLLTFVGKLDYLPNVEAVRYIAESLRPVVLSAHPNALFLMVGQNYEPLAVYADNHLRFVGFVDGRARVSPNLADYLSASDVVLVPLESGSGTRLKILEAASCGRAIVSTRVGAEGQAFRHGTEIWLTEHADDQFTSAVLRLLEDPEMRSSLGKGARQRVVEQYNWASEVRKFEPIYELLRK
jgi:glycosyltransferase involved in cell wall biosynthesis